MPEVANCPLCKNPQVEMLNEHSTPGGAYCCGVRCDSLELWNRYATAMELAEAKAWRQDVWKAVNDPWKFVKVLRERKSIESLLDIFDKSIEDVESAEKRVLEVFTQKQP